MFNYRFNYNQDEENIFFSIGKYLFVLCWTEIIVNEDNCTDDFLKWNQKGNNLILSKIYQKPCT